MSCLTTRPISGNLSNHSETSPPQASVDLFYLGSKRIISVVFTWDSGNSYCMLTSAIPLLVWAHAPHYSQLLLYQHIWTSELPTRYKDTKSKHIIFVSLCLSVLERRPSSSVSLSCVVPSEGEIDPFCAALARDGLAMCDQPQGKIPWITPPLPLKFNPAHGEDRRWDTSILP